MCWFPTVPTSVLITLPCMVRTVISKATSHHFGSVCTALFPRLSSHTVSVEQIAGLSSRRTLKGAYVRPTVTFHQPLGVIVVFCTACGALHVVRELLLLLPYLFIFYLLLFS